MADKTDENVGTDVDDPGKFPKAAYLIMFIFALIFLSSSIISGLSFYMTNRAGYTDDEARDITHIFSMWVLMTPIFAAIVADNWTGRYIVLLTGFILATIGITVLFLGSIPYLGISVRVSLWVMISFRSLGMGCVNAGIFPLCNDQFELPRQKKHFDNFLSINYAVYNFCACVSTLIFPTLREEVFCFGNRDCFALVFGIGAIMYLIITIVTILVRFFIVIKKPSGNVLLKVFSCVIYATAKRFKCIGASTYTMKNSWLDHAEDKYGAELVQDTKQIGGIAWCIWPLIFAHSVYMQFKSTWLFQGRYLDGWIGFMNIKPEQMLLIKNLSVVIVAPVYNYFVIPCFRNTRWGKPLPLIMVGCVLYLLSFVLSGLLQLGIEKRQSVQLEDGYGQLHILNTLNCTYQLSFPDYPDTKATLGPFEVYSNTKIKTCGELLYKITLNTTDSGCPQISKQHFEVVESDSRSYVILDGDTIESYNEITEKSAEAYPYVRILSNNEMWDKNKNITFTTADGFVGLNIPIEDRSEHVVFGQTYKVAIDDIEISEVTVENGGSYVYIIKDTECTEHILMNPNSIHILFQIPQFFVLTVGEVVCYVGSTQFCYREAPASLKAVSMAFYLLTKSFGDLVVIIVTKYPFRKKSNEFFFFCGMISITIVVMEYCIYDYKYVTEIWQKKPPKPRVVPSKVPVT